MKPLRDAIEEYLALRRSLGFKLHDTARGLRAFAAFLEQHAAPYITTALALEWAMLPVHQQPSEWARRLGFVRVFARHWRASDPRTEIPRPGCSRFARSAPSLTCTANRRFKRCWRPPRASPLPTGFDPGLITADWGCWSSVACALVRPSSSSAKMWIWTRPCSPSAKPSSTKPV